MARTKQLTETLDAQVAGKQVSVSMSTEVAAILENRAVPLVADAEILFSCLVRKRLTFRDASADLTRRSLWRPGASVASHSSVDYLLTDTILNDASGSP